MSGDLAARRRRRATRRGRGADPAEDPLAADRRTLTIGAIAMVGFILIGVVSAQLFARGACGAPADPVAVTATVVHPAALAEALEDGGGLTESLRNLFGASMVTAFEAAGATSLAPVVPGGLLVAGEGRASTLTVDGSGHALDLLGQVAGDGTAVFDLVVPNALTGQVDALVPVTVDGMVPGGCVDTALVGSPFAFLLDAHDGEVLLLRSDEEGGGSIAQVRDVDGAVADVPLRLPAGQPGVLAERQSGRFGTTMVVTARRAAPGDGGPVVVVGGRADGTVYHEIGLADLVAATGGDADVPQRATVHTVGTATALLSVHPDPAGGGADGTAAVLVRLELPTGALQAVGTLDGTIGAAAVDGDRHLAVVALDGDLSALVTVGPDGSLSVTEALPGTPVAAHFVDGRAVAATDRFLVVLDGDPSGGHALDGDLRLLDVATAADGRLALLVATDAQGTVVIVTDPLR